MESAAFEGRKEDYLFRATIRTEEHQIEDLRCKLYLPLTFSDPVLLYFHLNDDQAKILGGNRNLWKFSLRGEVGWPPQKTRIEADNVYVRKISNRAWGDITDRTLIAEAIDLKTIALRGHDSSDHLCKSEGNFWLTANELLSPALIIGHSYDGNVTVETLDPLDVTLVNGLRLVFKKHFKTRENDDAETVTSSHLVAEFDFDSVPYTFACLDSSITHCLDDFLLITSFASRYRCVWYGWEVFHPESHTKFYRKDVAIPKLNKQINFLDGLIRRADFEEFLDVAYLAFVHEEPRDLLRQALSYAIPREDQTIDSKFIRLYSALETLVLFFRRKNNLETVFAPHEEDQWNHFRHDFKRWLKDESVLKGNENRLKQRLIFGNLSALKRIAFSTAFNKCCKFYSVDLEDLWPVSNNATRPEVWSLSEIRNELVHGEKLTEPKLDSLVAAELHLQWTVERLLLAVLGWDVSRSGVSPERLKDNLFYQNWERECRVIKS